MKTIKNKRAFTIIELIVGMAIIGILVLLAMPKFMGNTKEAKLTEIKANTKQLENASERYYIDNQDWPRLTDVPYTSLQIDTFAQELTDKTGQVVTLDSAGSYYDIDYTKLQKYVQKPSNNTHYIIQNPVGEIYYLKNLTTAGETRLNIPEVINNNPTAVITMTPENNLNKNTVITWSYADSSDEDGDTIIKSEWMIDDILVANPPINLSPGNHTIKLRVLDSKNGWSTWISKTVIVDVIIVSTPNYCDNGQYIVRVNGEYTGTKACNLIDGVAATYWQSNGFAGTMTLELKQPKPLNTVTIITAMGQVGVMTIYDDKGAFLESTAVNIPTKIYYNPAYVYNYSVKSKSNIGKITVSGPDSNNRFNYFGFSDILVN